MSKTLDYLNNAQEHRENSLSSAKHTLLNAKPEFSEETKVRPTSQNGSAIATNKIVYSLIFLLFFISMSFNFGLFSMVKGSQSEKNKTIAKLNEIEESLNANAKKINALSSGIEELNRSINTRITELGKSLDTQSYAIVVLTKTQDILFTKVNGLENKEVPK